MTFTPPILALWSAPRSRSTAFLKMMSQRGDRTILHEPFSHVMNFGETSVGGRTVRGERELIEAIREEAAKGPVFFKDTTDFAYPGLLADTDFLKEATHTFIIRHPSEAIASHAAINPDLTCEEIGFSRLAEIYEAVRQATGHRPVVVDSDDLVADPAATVRAYCARTGIPFVPSALSWRPEMREEWVGTKVWHESTSRSQGFAATTAAYTRGPDNDPRLAEFLAFHLPFYEELRAHRLSVPAAAA
ncbi:sulfotransferase family protein [Streptomyces sp. G44]|uniref:sulfotransferase-like domain-containing protein n=1 Tax=Streptomyces sp. G44 TaxID=2807632 RepID=UPI0027DDAABB|nr:sulfotransferase family protein [Streptomyces sp. G44]